MTSHHTSQPVHLKDMNPWALITFSLLGFILGFAANNVLAMRSGTIMPSPSPTVAVAPQPSAPPQPANNTPPVIDEDDPMLGQENAKVTLVEFTDYQCPFCARYFTQTYGQIKANYVDTGKVKYVVKDFPLGFHANAQKSSEATQCAHDQDKFWEMHDLLFEKQAEWANAADAVGVFKGYASDLGLSASTFASCLDDGTHAEEVRKDMAAGQASGVSGTPGFWVIGPDGKGQIISGAVPYATFAAAIDARLK